MLGLRWLIILFKERSARGKLFVARQGPSVLGWMDQKQLRIILDPNSEEKVLVVDETSKLDSVLVRKFPGVFGKNLGAPKGFEHTIVLKENAEPKVHKARLVPMLVRTN